MEKMFEHMTDASLLERYRAYDLVLKSLYARIESIPAERRDASDYVENLRFQVSVCRDAVIEIGGILGRRNPSPASGRNRELPRLHEAV